MTWGLSFMLSLAVLLTPPIMQGDATYYAEPYIGRIMQNGETYTGQDATCAVAVERWPELRGKTLVVCTDWRCIPVTVTDTGGGLGRDDVDLSEAAFRALFGKLGVGRGRVRVWVAE